MTVRFLDIAEAELDDAIRWYQTQAPGLGEAFLLEVMTAANRIARYPEAWHLLEQGIRRCRLTRFPYGLIYAIEKEDILVLAVAHLHRKPDYWRDRVEKKYFGRQSIAAANPNPPPASSSPAAASHCPTARSWPRACA